MPIARASRSCSSRSGTSSAVSRSRRFTSLIFMVTRVMAASVRLAVPAIPIALILGVPVWIAILLLAAATALYTYVGGIKAAIWIDLIQVVVYLSGATMALWVLVHSFDGGFGGILRRCAELGRPVRPVSYTHLRAHETRHDLVCRLLLEKKKKK